MSSRRWFEIEHFVRSSLKLKIQSNPLNGSPDNGSILLLVQVLASPISLLITHYIMRI